MKHKFSHYKILQALLKCIAYYKAHIWNITTDNRLANITPKYITIYINIRYRTVKILNSLLTSLQSLIAHTKYYQVTYQILSTAHPFKTNKAAKLARILQTYTQAQIQNNHGGTSDGRFIAPISKYIVELGLINKTIHSKNENISIKAFT
ncbi:M20/M25/M40 family metallo-hydrolase [Candidatus Vidania fulgoroideae]|nr:M20/M25/M40 family metallo-hydrolase [Candidatus Vidania fulgoroideae]